ncbi:MAG: hypothetical protein JSV21_03010 [Nitrospirota bacterium]|nr:MAG: hypothetical protein JSV21_03010 [Nitrospirota bacterium]
MKPAKTAGTSILREFLEIRVSGIIHYKDHPQEFESWLNRIDDNSLKKYFIFSVVRNPWDRLVSIASYFKIPFHQFVRNIREYWKDPDIRVHSLPVNLYTHYSGARFADIICRFENLQRDFDLVCSKLDIEPTTLPHANRSKHKHYSTYYDDNEIELVADIYADDIRLFGYRYHRNNHIASFKDIIKKLTSRFSSNK